MRSISQKIFENAMLNPDKQAIICGDNVLTYRQFSEKVSRISRALKSRGISRGDHIGIVLPNCIEFVICMLVAADLGAVIVPVSSHLPAKAIHHILQASDVKHIITMGGTIKDFLSSGLDFTFISGVWLSVDIKVKAAISMRALIKEVPSDIKALNIGKEDDPFILLTTSGSTGDPKPIILTQRTKWNRAFAAVELYKVTSEDRTLAATPLYHSLAERLVLIPLLTGGTSIIMPQFSALEWFRCVQKNKVTFTIAVSSQLRQISEQLSSSDAKNSKIKSMRCIVSSSELLEPKIKKELLKGLHCDFHECYGASEIAIASDLDCEAAKRKVNSVGRAAPEVDIKIVDKNGNDLTPGSPGEIICKTPMIFSGYYKRPNLTAAAMYGEYFRTGDLGKLDKEGFLYFLGREKDIIITGGINVYPSDIEYTLASQGSVQESAAFPYTDKRLGEVVAVAIVPKKPKEFDLRGIKRYCAENLADFQMPRKYFIVNKIPKNTMGKTMRRILAKQFCDIMGNKKDG